MTRREDRPRGRVPSETGGTELCQQNAAYPWPSFPLPPQWLVLWSNVSLNELLIDGPQLLHVRLAVALAVEVVLLELLHPLQGQAGEGGRGQGKRRKGGGERVVECSTG